MRLIGDNLFEHDIFDGGASGNGNHDSVDENHDYKPIGNNKTSKTSSLFLNGTKSINFLL